jgi:hypothetical protein
VITIEASWKNFIDTVFFAKDMSQTNFQKAIESANHCNGHTKGSEMKKLQWLSQNITVQTILILSIYCNQDIYKINNLKMH